MSVQAAVNGAQRDIGLYAGIDGAVRALFASNEMSDLSGISGADAGMSENIPYDVSEYTFVIVEAFYLRASNTERQFLLILPKLRVSLALKTNSSSSSSAYLSSFRSDDNTISVYTFGDSRSHATYSPSANTLTSNVVNNIRLYK